MVYYVLSANLEEIFMFEQNWTAKRKLISEVENSTPDWLNFSWWWIEIRNRSGMLRAATDKIKDTFHSFIRQQERPYKCNSNFAGTYTKRMFTCKAYRQHCPPYTQHRSISVRDWCVNVSPTWTVAWMSPTFYRSTNT